MEIYDLKYKKEFLSEVMELEFLEWSNKKDINKEDINKKIDKYFKYVNDIAFCKLILVEKDTLIGFISIFPYDSIEELELSPWYSTMYIKKEYRGKGYSKILNDSILKEAKSRGFKKIYLKTELDNYYEKFGAKYIKNLNNTEKLMYFDL